MAFKKLAATQNWESESYTAQSWIQPHLKPLQSMEMKTSKQSPAHCAWAT